MLDTTLKRLTWVFSGSQIKNDHFYRRSQLRKYVTEEGYLIAERTTQ